MKIEKSKSLSFENTNQFLLFVCIQNGRGNWRCCLFHPLSIMAESTADKLYQILFYFLISMLLLTRSCWFWWLRLRWIPPFRPPSPLVEMVRWLRWWDDWDGTSSPPLTHHHPPFEVSYSVALRGACINQTGWFLSRLIWRFSKKSHYRHPSTCWQYRLMEDNTENAFTQRPHPMQWHISVQLQCGEGSLQLYNMQSATNLRASQMWLCRLHDVF